VVLDHMAYHMPCMFIDLFQRLGVNIESGHCFFPRYILGILLSDLAFYIEVNSSLALKLLIFK
jgi:hypothetical protein